MPEKTAALEQLMSFLNRLFQFETQDLDFGIYKILHYKREQIQRFIDELLVERIQNQLISLKDSTVMDLEGQLADLEESAHIKKWLQARQNNQADKAAIYEEDFKEDTQRYKRIKLKIDAARAERDTQAVIYNHLTVFFSRYYDNGDFISKRRFGKNEKYVVPYNGEETHFYWANHDQYYIKSSETFRKYAFKAPGLTEDLIVSFKLTDAWIEQGNVKEAENKYFVLSEQEPVLAGNELTVYFEYRPLNEKEKRDLGNQGKQEKLNVSAGERVQSKFGKDPHTTQLWIEEDGESLFLKKLHHYTRKNHYDFFVHKDLKGFLQRELDFYIKSELVRVDDLYVLETEQHFENVRLNFKAIKVFKNIADTIIEFLSQIEEFQKKLWEKKKFVIQTDWVITIDKLVEWLGKDLAAPFLEEALNNDAQRREWRDLFGEEALSHDRTVSGLKQELFGWKKLPIDTVHFHLEFKERFLNALSEKIDLEDMADGLVIHSDNFHALRQIEDKFRQSVDVVHIDPPYNTDSSGFLYKNSYRRSSWLTMMNDRIGLVNELLKSDSSFLCHIDEYEFENLYHLIASKKYPYLGTLVWDKRNPMMGGSGLAVQHEFIIWASNHLGQFESKSQNVKAILSKAQSLIEKHKGVNELSRNEFEKWVKAQKNFSGGERMYCLIEDDGRVYRLVAMTWPNPNPPPERFFVPLIHPVTKKACPVPSRGWSRTPEKMKELLDKDEIVFGVDESTQPQRKIYLNARNKKPLSTILSSGKRGKAEVEQLGLGFSYCHPTSVYEEVNFASGSKNGWTVDFFAGSGTNFHATQSLNKSDGGTRKCLLVEQGDYVYTVIIPRIKKIAYTFDWKDGRPKNGTMNGLGVFFKYQRLEQYEEALENIAFTKDEVTVQTALELDVYMPRYFLNFETQGSRTLVNVEDLFDPWNYTLRVWDGFTYDTEQAVDIPETFNYLIGLHMQKCITREIAGKRYQFVQGVTNDNKRVLVVWRNVKAWRLEDYKRDSQVLKAELAAFQYDLLYINGQAHFEGYLPVEEVFKNRMVH